MSREIWSNKPEDFKYCFEGHVDNMTFLWMQNLLIVFYLSTRCKRYTINNLNYM